MTRDRGARRTVAADRRVFAKEHHQPRPTTDGVEQVLGKPEKIGSLSAKTIYMYKYLKVVFVDSEVLDVQ
jgi:hypothetical protein